MTGICGWISFSGSNEVNALDRMADKLLTPIGGDICCHIGNGFALATVAHPELGGLHVRDNIAVCLAGRPHWVDAGMTDLASKHGHAYAIAEAYQIHGIGFLQKISGTFSLAIIDLSSCQLTLSIDRIGVAPLAYAKVKDGVIFASNTQSLKQHPAINAEVCPQAVFDYMYFHVVPSPRTIYHDQQKLLPAQYARINATSMERAFYWSEIYQDNNPAPIHQLESEFSGLLRDCMRRAIGEQSVGCFLSGGTDSSTMAGILAEVSGQPTETFSIGFDDKDFDETEYADIAVRHFGTRHHRYYVTPQDVADAIPLIAASYDEPFGNASAIGAYYCAKMAREAGINTMIAGDGGDEIFGGNTRYLKQQVFELYQSIPAVIREHMLEPLANNKIIPIPGKARSYINQARIPLPDRLETYNFLHRAPLTDIFTEEFLAKIDSHEPLRLLRDTYTQANSNSSLNKMLHLDLKTTLADNDLRKVNHTCAMAGVNVRYPLLDDAMVEFASRVPTGLKIKGQQLRYFFKHALRDFLPPEILTKSKHGFGLPFGLWMKSHGPLRDLAGDSLSNLRKRGYVTDQYIDQLLDQHSSQHATYFGVMIWVLMMLEQWLESH